MKKCERVVVASLYEDERKSKQNVQKTNVKSLPPFLFPHLDYDRRKWLAPSQHVKAGPRERVPVMSDRNLRASFFEWKDVSSVRNGVHNSGA